MDAGLMRLDENYCCLTRNFTDQAPQLGPLPTQVDTALKSEMVASSANETENDALTMDSPSSSTW